MNVGPLIDNARKLAAEEGNKGLQKYWNGLSEAERNAFSADMRKELKALASKADEAA